MGGPKTCRRPPSRMGVICSVFFALMALPATALADIEGGCTGSVEIDGVTYGRENDTTDNPIVVPIDDEGVAAAWQGQVPFENQDHSGSVGIVVGPWTIQIADWGGANPADTRSSSGTYGIEEFKDQFPVPTALIPRGVFELSGEHRAAGGECTGTVMVELEGSSAYGIGGAVATAVAFLGVLMAGVSRRQS